MQLLNIRFSFLCRITHSNEEGKNPIILRVTFRGERRDIFTGLYCFKEAWDSHSGTVLKTDKSFKTKNDNLKIILQRVTLAFDELKFSGVSFTIHELVAKIKGYEMKPSLLIDFLEDSLKKLKERQAVDITLATYYKYRTSLEHVKDFLLSKYKIKNIALQKVDKEFLDEYFLYLRREKNISHNSSIKYLGFFKSFLSPAIKSNLIKQDPFKDLRLKPKQIFIMARLPLLFILSLKRMV